MANISMFPANADGEKQPYHGMAPEADRVKSEATEAPEGSNPEHLDNETERAYRTEEVTKLARRATERSIFSNHAAGTDGDPFGRDDDVLDPSSEKFSARAWSKAALRGQLSAHPELSRTAGVAIKNLKAHGFGSDTDYQKTVANVPLELKTMARNIVGSTKRRIDILRNVDALVHPGEMLVVLGPPGSGCSTFLKSIAGETHGLYLNDDEYYMNYSGISAKQMHSQFRGEVTLTAETDVHFPSLPVGETLYFAARCRTPRMLPPGVSAKEYAETIRDVTMATYGMTHTMNTQVGNEFVRGVSGGERKRVSIIEAALSRAPLQCWDNSTRGLDSANAIEFCKTLRMNAEIFGTTAAVSLYQAPEDAYKCFDKVTVLYEGRQIYFGPAQEAKTFFINMGFDCPSRQTTPDFLTSLTSPKERKARPGYERQVPNTPDEFVERWRSSEAYTQLMRDIDENDKQHPIGGQDLEKFQTSRRAQQAKNQRVKSPYTLSYLQQVQICLWRGFRRLASDPSLTLTQLIGNTIFALILASIFYNLQPNTESFYQRGALLFFAILFNAFASALEILTLYAQRPIVEKHTRYALYHPSAEAIASMLTDIPYKIVNTTLFNLVIYFMANLRREPGPFFYFLFISFLLVLTISSFFRTVASASRTLAEALAPAAIIILGLVLYAGFALPSPSMPGWSSWMRWINPVYYGLECLFINEFQGRQFECSQFVPSGPAYANVAPDEQVCTTVSAQTGSSTIDGTAYIQQSYQYFPSHQWRNVGIIIGLWVFFTLTYVFFSEFISERKSKGEVLIFKRSFLKKAKKEAKLQGTDDLEAALAHEKTTPSDADNTSQEEINIQRQTSVFSWRDVRFSVKIKKEERMILSGVDGWVKPGTLTALMGASGAGKTSLLDALANRTTTGVITGEMLVNGKPRDASFQRKTGYALQQDIDLPTATVREALTFSALLRQPARFTKQDRLDYVDEVIKLLEMHPYADAVVGVPGEGLNVEQRKRLTIGIELAAKPELLLFLDEPTSGLDSQTSWSIMNLLRKLTHEAGQAVLCTIHQPSAILFQRFDRLLLLARGGRTVYFGDIGPDSSTMIDYFEKNGGSPCPKDKNPAEMMLEWIGAAPGSHTEIDWPETWNASPERQAVHEELDRLAAQKDADPDTDDQSKYSEYAVGFPTQLKAATIRAFQQTWRSPAYIYSKVLMSIIASLYIGFSFFQISTSIQALQAQLFAVFMIFIIFSQLVQQIQPQFVIQRDLYEARERPSKTYSWQAFMISNIVVELPWNTLVAACMYFCWYYPIGYYHNATSGDLHERGALMFLYLVAFLWFASTFAHMTIAAAPNAEVAGNMGNLLFTLTLLFCGVLATADELPGFWIFMVRCNPFTYLVAGMLSTGLGKSSVQCADREFVTFQPAGGQTCGAYLESYPVGYLANPQATSDCSYCPIANTDTFLATLDSYYGDIWRNFGLLWAFIVFNIAAAVFLYWLGRVPKNPMKTKKA